MKQLFKIGWHGLRSEQSRLRLVGAAVILAVVGLIQIAYAQNSDLAGYWPFDEGSGQVAADSSGHDNDGTLGSTSSADDNDPTWISDGVNGTSALHFGGDANQFVKVPDSGTLESATITAEAWVRYLGFPGSFRYILAKGANVCSAASYALYTGGTGGLFFYVSPDGIGANVILSPDAQEQVVIWDGDWHHVVGTFDGSVVRLYVDEDEIGSGTPTTSSVGYGLPTSDDLYIGAYGYTGTELGACDSPPGLPFPGDIDGVKVWTRALSLPEIINTPPTADAGGPYEGDEGSAIALNGASASDQDGDDLTYSWTVDSDLCAFDDTTALNPNLTCTDNGIFTVTLTVDDGQGATVSDTASVTVSNVSPTVESITVNQPLVPVDTPILATAIFTDPGIADTHTAVWEWGDGTSATVDPATSPTSTSHVYSVAGVYTVKLTVADDDGGSDTSEFHYVVVYDPSAGFVTGGGWIDSPAGACQFDACAYDTTGKASFGFVAKYKKGQNTPEGNTQFQFKAGDLNFHSSSYEWLVVAKAKAQYKGVGTINGGGNYGFKLMAIDENLTPSTDVDLFRIKIWDIDNGDVVVYDNEPGEAEDADPTTQIGGGSIVIHSGK